MTPSKVFIIQTAISSPNQIEDSKDIDDRTFETTLTFDKETRAKITTARNVCRNRLTTLCLSFFGLRVANESVVPEIAEIIGTADAELKAIHPNLRARFVQIPLVTREGGARNEVYNQVVEAIRGNVLKVLMERLEKLAQVKSVPTRSRVALLELCDRLSTWNVVDDPDIARTIAEYRVQFEHNVFAPVLEDMKKEYEAISAAASSPANWAEV